MNKHIELVKRWLADNDSVTSAELQDSRTALDAALDAAYAVADAAARASADAAAYVALDAAYAAADAAVRAAAAARASDGDVAYAARAARSAARWVKRYEELVNEELTNEK